MGSLWLLGAAALLLFGAGGGDNNWSQPPVQIGEEQNVPVFDGWNQLSIDNYSWHAADDWQSTSTQPVTGINWWGSYIGWRYESLPAVTPAGFKLAIYSNGSANAPESLIWSHTTSSFTQQFTGMKSLDGNLLDSSFSYSTVLPESAWFTPLAAGEIYWLSISAVYDGNPPPMCQWGWSTRPFFFGNGAVWTCGQGWDPIVWDGDGWDLAFELRSGIIDNDPSIIPEWNSLGLMLMGSGMFGVLRYSRRRR